MDFSYNTFHRISFKKKFKRMFTGVPIALQQVRKDSFDKQVKSR